MNSSRKVFEEEIEEQASLHVLELLPSEEQRDFERRLAVDPALREFVRELQGNLEALALTEPSQPAPPRVWGRIAGKIRADSAPAFPVWARTWSLQLLAAAACLVLGALAHSAWSRSIFPPDGPPILVQSQPSSPSGSSAVPNIPETRKNFAKVRVPFPPAPASNAFSNTGDPTAKVPADTTNAGGAIADAARLRGRVQMLAAQLSALNQVLEQQQQERLLPPGVTRLHVFQLVTTNHPSVVRGLSGTGAEPATAPLPELLAQLAATRLTPGNKTTLQNPSDSPQVEPLPIGATTPSGSAGTVASTFPPQNLPIAAITHSPTLNRNLPITTPPITTLTPTPDQTTPLLTGNTPIPSSSVGADEALSSVTPPTIHPAELEPASVVASSGSPAFQYSGQSLNSPNNLNSPSFGEGVAYGFVSPDSGIGTIALSNHQPLERNEVFQVWSSTVGPGAISIIQSLGTAYAEGPVVVLKFELQSTGTTLPSLMVTREPMGGSLTPTGPVIVGPRPSP